MTTIEEIRDIMHSNEPFEIALSDGRRFKVIHGDFVAISPSGHTLTVYDHQGYKNTLVVSNITTISTKEADAAEIQQA